MVMCDFDEFIHTTKDGRIMEIEVRITEQENGQMTSLYCGLYWCVCGKCVIMRYPPMLADKRQRTLRG